MVLMPSPMIETKKKTIQRNYVLIRDKKTGQNIRLLRTCHEKGWYWERYDNHDTSHLYHLISDAIDANNNRCIQWRNQP